MSKLIIVIFFLIVSVVIVLASLTFKILQPKPIQITGSDQVVNKDGTLNVSLDVSNPSIDPIKLVYGIKSKLMALNKVGGQTQLTIDSDIKNLPMLITTPNTLVFQKTVPAKIEDVKVGQQVKIIIYYDIRLKQWFLETIVIL